MRGNCVPAHTLYSHSDAHACAEAVRPPAAAPAMQNARSSAHAWAQHSASEASLIDEVRAKMAEIKMAEAKKK